MQQPMVTLLLLLACGCGASAVGAPAAAAGALLLARARGATALALPPALAALATRENLHKYHLEVAAAACIVVFILNYFWGCSANQRVAHFWLRVLGRQDGVLARNFAVVPHPDKPNTTWADGPDRFNTYATGRRFCHGALVTVNTRPRQDLFQQVWSLLSPTQETLEVLVRLNEGCCPPVVLAWGHARGLQELLRDKPGIRTYTKPVAVTRDRANSWSIEHAKGWSVMSESSHFFYDLLNTEPAIARAFGHKWFRSALITSEDLDAGATPGGGSSSSSPDSSSAGGSSSSKDGAGGSDGDEPKGLVNIRCRFTLPPESAADELQQMVAAVFVLVDLVGGYKVPPDMKKRAADLRARLLQEAAKKRSEGRQGELAAKRQERLEAERAKARAAGPAALQKFEERLQRQQRGREMRKRIKHM